MPKLPYKPLKTKSLYRQQIEPPKSNAEHLNQILTTVLCAHRHSAFCIRHLKYKDKSRCEHGSIPLLLELGFHGGLLNYCGEKKKKSAAYWVPLTESERHSHTPLSPTEPVFPFTTNTSGTNISIHSFCHFLLLSTKAYETSQKTTNLFYLIYSFILMLQRIKKTQRINLLYHTP